MTEPRCPYCGYKAKLVTGADVYPSRRDLRAKKLWRCAPCQAWVGCHPGTTTPLGRLANAELRQAKMRAHAAFDPVWKAKIAEGLSKHHARGSAYKWLAEQIGVEREDCHIGMFDVALCDAVVRACDDRHD